MSKIRKAWKVTDTYAHNPHLPGVKIAICTVQGVEKYAVYRGRTLVRVATDMDEAKAIAEGAG